MLKWAVTLLIMGAGFLLFWSFLPHTRDFQVYQYLAMPHILERPDQSMLVVKVSGDPEQVGQKALAALFKAFYALKKQNRQMALEAPRARWFQSPDTPGAAWSGVYGLPIPAAVKSLPKPAPKSEFVPSLELWKYGVMAEIMHLGPYSEESASIEKLKQFIAEQGYVVTGACEEEYVVGSGVFGRGNPKKYQTLIRYPVEKKPATPTVSVTPVP